MKILTQNTANVIFKIGKPLKIIKKPMIFHVYKRAEMYFKDLYIATCDKEIYDYTKSINAAVIMTSKKHKRAMKVYEAIKKLKIKKNKL